MAGIGNSSRRRASDGTGDLVVAVDCGGTKEEAALVDAAGVVAVSAVERSASAIGRASASAGTVLDVVVIGGGFSKVTSDLEITLNVNVDIFHKHRCTMEFSG
jgi:predicted NBD/HSP70 family sugar kinase